MYVDTAVETAGSLEGDVKEHRAVYEVRSFKVEVNS